MHGVGGALWKSQATSSPSRKGRRRGRGADVASSTRKRAWLLALLSVKFAEGILPRSSSVKYLATRSAASSRVSLSISGSPSLLGKPRSVCSHVFCVKDEIADRSSTGHPIHTLLIDNHDSYTYNLFQQLAAVNGRAPFVVYNDDDGGNFWKAVERMGRVPDNIVISPGPGRPDVPEDFGMCAQALREATNIPLLGVCLGHEGLGIVHGARVTRAPEPMHGRLSPVFHNNADPLFRGVPQGASVVRYHSLHVDANTLAAGGPLEATAWTGDGILMAMRHRESPHWGVQFHPESIGTRHGSAIVQNFRDLTEEWNRTQGRNLEHDGEERRPTDGARMSPAGSALKTSRVAAGGDAQPVREEAVDSKDVSSKGEGQDSLSESATYPAFVLHGQKISLSGTPAERPACGTHEAAVDTEAALDTEIVFRTLYGDHSTAWWLDSSSRRPGLAVDGQAKARFSFMGGSDGPLSQIVECRPGGRLLVEAAPESAQKSGCARPRSRREVRANVLDFVKSEMARLCGVSKRGGAVEVCMLQGERQEQETESVADGRIGDGGGKSFALPFDFTGGFVGFLGYELRHDAKEVLDRSAGGTGWSWKPPDGGMWAGHASGHDTAHRGAHDRGESRGRSLDSQDVPLGFLVFADRFLAFDHETGDAFALALTRVRDESEETGAREGRDTGRRSSDPAEVEALQWIQQMVTVLRRLSGEARDDHGLRSDTGTAARGPDTGEVPAPSSGEASTACAMDVPRARYERGLHEIMRLVGQGETYEVCLTNQIVCERPGAGRTSPLELYSRLRRANPAPYAAFIVHDPDRRLQAEGDRAQVAEGESRPSFAVCCSSPERFLKVDQHGWAESKPIKGTVKRGGTPAEDLALANELARGEKNTAENLMIVDLVRNDLGRVCQTGTVSVPKLMHVESYATVHQLVTTIRGKLSDDCGALDAIAAAFPGGSMTGAPKQRTMEIIDELEHGRPRGVYSGSIGFLGLDGASDMNIVIRTAVVTPQNVTVGAGGAVIALSDVDEEYDEMLLKATSVLGAIGFRQRSGRSGPPGSESPRREHLPRQNFVDAPVAKRDLHERNEILRPMGTSAYVNEGQVSSNDDLSTLVKRRGGDETARPPSRQG